MEKKEKEKKERKPKEKKVREVGLHKWRVYILWGIFIAAFAFAIYKNFTAIDRIETVKTETVRETVVSTQPIEEYAKRFLEIYFTWSKESVTDRVVQLEEYLTDPDLLRYATNMLPNTIENSSALYKKNIWNVTKETEDEYSMIVEIGQTIASGADKDVSYENIETVYELWVYKDENGDMVITKLPTLAELPERSDYQKAQSVEMEGIEAEQKAQVQEFLEDFFRIYPASSDQELKYYANENVMPVIEEDGYEFVAVDQALITSMDQTSATVEVVVSYKQSMSDTVQYYQYNLKLEKLDTWKIVEMR